MIYPCCLPMQSLLKLFPKSTRTCLCAISMESLTIIAMIYPCFNDLPPYFREYDDLSYLDHQLVTSNRQPGIIYPPLPPRPLTGGNFTLNMRMLLPPTNFIYSHLFDRLTLDAASAESRSRRQLGSSNRAVLGDSNQWAKVIFGGGMIRHMYMCQLLRDLICHNRSACIYSS